jgi:rSAM/selenodomain-associated transferase 1
MRRGAEQAAIAVFAKAPVAGLAKTRLIPEIGAEGAAKLQARLIEQAVTIALAADLGPVSLWCMPDCEHQLFQSLAAKCGIALHKQTGADLGARMLQAFETLTPRLPTLLIGTDCPALRPEHLSDSLEALDADTDAVFIPAEDGGYVLAGMKRPHPELFSGISWGTSEVMSQTHGRASQSKLRIAEPATLWDLDNPADYRRAVSLGLI